MPKELELWIAEGKIRDDAGEVFDDVVIHISNGNKVNLKDMLKELGEL